MSPSNAVELIVSIIALVATPPEIIIVQTSLIGSILSNLLLVMGMCFFFGGVSALRFVKLLYSAELTMHIDKPG